MKYEIRECGVVNGRPINAITLANRAGLEVCILTYGCIVQSLKVPDNKGVSGDVVLGYDHFDSYLKGHPFFGAIVGRYANRIHDGCFCLNGQTWRLECNEASTGQHLHGGSNGFGTAVWGYSLEEAPDGLWLHLHHTSPDGDAGYPGRVDVVHTIGLDEHNKLWFNFRAVSSRDTIINLANHSYYNLSGNGLQAVGDHDLMLAADYFTPVSDNMIPTGAVLPVADTAWDFRVARSLSAAMAARPARDFDANFAVRHDAKAHDGLALAADLYHPGSGRGMRVRTTQPGVQFYNGFKLGDQEWYGKGGGPYPACAGLCLETQHFPDSPNQPHFPSTVIKAGCLWEERTVHEFYQR